MDADPLAAARAAMVRGDRSVPPAEESRSSAVSWAAVFAGAAGSAALSLIFLVLGVGLGLSSVSPWASHGVSATSLGVGTIVWILFVALAASGTGGYLAGRLRTKWVQTHSDEVYFRDTAHGFLAWAIATLVTAGLLTSAIGTVVGVGVDAGGSALGAAGSAATGLAAGGAGAMAASSKPENSSSSLGYFTDSLFRPAAATSAAPGASGAAGATDQLNAGASTSEVGRIFGRSLSGGAMSAPSTSASWSRSAPE